MRPNTVTTIVNALTAQGMISRAAPEGDRRAIELNSTGGRALAAAVPALGPLAQAVDRLADAAGSPADPAPGQLPAPAEPVPA